jgi:hypothetical protein
VVGLALVAIAIILIRVSNKKKKISADDRASLFMPSAPLYDEDKAENNMLDTIEDAH